jgi:hypothetical protein
MAFGKNQITVTSYKAGHGKIKIVNKEMGISGSRELVKGDEMQHSFLLWALLVFSWTVMPARVVAQNSEEDIRIIRSWVELPYGFAVGNSFSEKLIQRGGDSIALAVIQAFSHEELLDTGRIERLLPILEVAFERPNHINRKYDRNPRATMLLLDFLKGHVEDERLQQKIEATKKGILNSLAVNTAPKAVKE